MSPWQLPKFEGAAVESTLSAYKIKRLGQRKMPLVETEGLP